MKKILSIFITAIVLLSVMCLSVSAETNTKEWTRLTGSASLDINSEGTTVTGAEGVSFYKYTKSKVDITDFTCTFTLEQENYWDGHDGSHRYYYSVILTNKAAHSGSQGLFLLLFPTSGSSLRIEGQILNTGFLLSPTFVEFDVPVMEPITMHGKVVDGNYYEISFDNSKQTYKFEIPVNYQFHKDLDGEGYFGFGATIHSEGETAKMTVTEVNGIEMKNTQAPQVSEEQKTEENQAGTNANTNTNTNANQSTSQGTTVDSSMFIILIVALVVLFLIVVSGFVVLILVLNKKLGK